MFHRQYNDMYQLAAGTHCRM